MQTYNYQLAYLAELNVKRCIMGHDACHNTPDFPWSGQNVGLRARTGSFEEYRSFFTIIINAFYDEVQYAVQEDIDKCCQAKSGKPIGHFTLVVADKATEVGCAVARYTDTKWKTSLFLCNYSFTNLNGWPVYENGTAASGCTTGVNPDFPALCSVDEPIKALP